MKFQRSRPAKSHRRPSHRRGLAYRSGMLESLERRDMLAGDLDASWHNAWNPRDVNFDGRVTTSDLLVIINDLLKHGPRTLSVEEATPLSAMAGAPKPKYLDVNNDGRVTVADAMIVVNALLADNNMLVRTVVTDMADNPISQISVGSQFKLQTIVQDIRTPPPASQGVFSAAADITFNASLSTIDTSQTVTVAPYFNFQTDFTLQQGRVIGWGSNALNPPPGNNPQFLFSVVLTASAGGVQTFMPSYSTNIDHEYLMFLFDGEVPAETIVFEGSTLTILDVPGLSINDVTQFEGNVDTVFEFTVQMSAAADEPVTVEFTTVDGTATVADDDYIPTSGTLTFAPGQTTAIIPVTVRGDTKVEPDETFFVVLSNVSSNATITDSTATGTILNDDEQGTLSITGSTVNNVPVGTTTALATVTLSQPIGTPVTVQYSTANGTALAGVDYQATSGTLTFTPGGSLTQTIPVTIIGNSNPGPIKAFSVNLTNPSSNAVIGVGQATIQIVPAVAAITASITPLVSGLEGGPGDLTPFVFTVTLSAAPAETVLVAYETADGTATVANNDYQPTSGTLTFDPGQTTQAITVLVVGDNVPEPSETFFVNFEAIQGAVGSGQGVGNIIDDDGTPTLTVNDVTVSAGPGITHAIFSVTLAGAVTQPITVGFATSNGSAVAGVDYLSTSGNLEFVPGGPAVQTISVVVLGTSGPAPDKTFFMNLSSVTGGAVIGDEQGIATIITQGLSISDVVVVEGNEGTRDAVFTVTLSRQSDTPVTVEYTTVDGTATVADNDYIPVSGTLTFAPGQSVQLITVQVVGDTVPEANETFRVILSNAVGAPIFNAEGTGTILNDDGQKVAYLLSLSDEFGNPLPSNTQFDVGNEFFLDVYVQDVQIDPTGVAQAFIDVAYNDTLLEVIPSSLQFGSFYDTALQTFDFQPGLLNDFGSFGSLTEPPANPGDALLFFRVQFRAIDVGLATFTGSVSEDDLNPGNETILYEDDFPVPSEQMSVVPLGGLSINIGANVITVADAVASEGAGQMVFTVTRFLPSAETATVEFQTADGTAIAGLDYIATSGTLTFDAANPVRFVTVTIIDDMLDEPDETFFLILSNPQGASISGTPTATGTILDNDAPVNVSVTGGSAPEGEGVVFNISLSAPSGKTVTVVYATTGAGTATPGEDYVPVSGTLTFAPGTTMQSVTVQTLSDILLEPNETFQLALSSPVNANLGVSEATGTIIDVPPAGISGFVYVDLNNNGLKDANETGIAGVIITATNNQSGESHTTTTAADGSFLFVGLIPGMYTVTQTQPGFYLDGRDTRFGIDSPFNDQFVGIGLAPSAAESGFLFGELGIRPEFITAFINRRALFGSSVVGGFGADVNTPGTTLNLKSGDIWVSFDGGWSGLRQIDAYFDASQGNATMKLYNYNLQEVAFSTATPTGAMLLYNGTPGQTYFLRITGSNPNVVVELTDPVAFSNLVATGGDQSNTDPPANNQSAGGDSSGGTTTYYYNRFGQAIPMNAPSADPLVADNSSDDAFAEDEDWLLESLLA